MCNKYANSNKKETLRTHEIPRQPWQKLGMDLFELNSQTYLILVDYYSKFPEICYLNKNFTTSTGCPFYLFPPYGLVIGNT
jgi:hypothetical protein